VSETLDVYASPAFVVADGDGDDDDEAAEVDPSSEGYDLLHL
jgi:hypothetical protein